MSNPKKKHLARVTAVAALVAPMAAFPGCGDEFTSCIERRACPLGGQAGMGGFAGVGGQPDDSIGGAAGSVSHGHRGGSEGTPTGFAGAAGEAGGSAAGESGSGGAPDTDGGLGPAGGVSSGGSGGVPATGGVGSAPFVTQLAAGPTATCARKSDGSVWCWGQLNSALGSPVPTKVQGLSTAVAVAVGGNHACALTNDARAVCWGSAEHGVLGNGDAVTTPALPVQATLNGNVSIVSAGEEFSCGVLQTGDVSCWGDNSFGQIGQDRTVAFSASPASIAIGGVTALSSSMTHSCAVSYGSQIQCWGSNAFGELGDGEGAFNPAPVTVPNLMAPRAVAAGGTHSCVVLEGGTVWCWGAGSAGQLGNGSTSDRVASPVQATGISTAVAVTAGDRFTCALLANGTVSCWGRGGSTGDGTSSPRSSPTNVVSASRTGSLSDVTYVAAAGEHACAVSSGGAVYCWGSLDHGANGDPDSRDRDAPVRVGGL